MFNIVIFALDGSIGYQADSASGCVYMLNMFAIKHITGPWIFIHWIDMQINVK